MNKIATRSPDTARNGADPTDAKLRVIVLDKLPASGLEPLTQSDRIQIVVRTGLSGKQLADALDEADAVIVRSSTQITREALADVTHLRVIGRAGVGVDNIDLDAATERGIAVLNAPSGNTVSAAEHAFALLLSLVRRVADADRSMRRGEWDRQSHLGHELRGKTLGLIGGGRVGSEVARRARAFGMQVLAYDPHLTAERAKALDIELLELDDVLAGADVVSLHVPLTDETRGLLSAERIGRMKEGAFLVNAARGGVIDEAALIEALRTSHIAGAALDVFASEPLPSDDPLRSAPNVVLTPHLGAATVEAQENVAREIAGAVRDALLQGDLSRAVNAPAIGGDAMRKLRPLLELAERLGRIACTMSGGALERVDVRYAGPMDHVLTPLASSALAGVLGAVVGRNAVNLVNARHLARNRGITTGRTRLAQHKTFGDYVEVAAAGDRGSVSVAGALLDAAHPRVVRINDFRVDVRPRGTLVILRNRDVPGVIGRVGSLLGNAGVNIAEYHQARLEEGGEALAAISVDDPLPPALLSALCEVKDVIEARQVLLD